MALGQTAGCPRVNRAKKFMCSPRNTGNINFSLWLTGRGVPKSEFSGSQKGGGKGEVKRGEVVAE